MNSRDKRKKAKANRVKSENGEPVRPPMQLTPVEFRDGLYEYGATGVPTTMLRVDTRIVVGRGKSYGSPAPTPDLAKEPAPFRHSPDPENEYAPSYKPGKQ